MQKHWHIINIVYIMFLYVFIKYVHLIMLYLLFFCHCFRFSQTLLCHWLKGFQRCFKDFMFQYVSRSIKNIQKTTKEWYPQALQTKHNVQIILQQLCPPFPRGEKRGKNEIKHFSSQSPGLPFYRHASVCRTPGVPFYRDWVPFFRELL